MSSGSDRQRAELARELRQFQGLSASVFRAAATKRELTTTDVQVLDLLGSGGPATAGQLADLTGLTTGAITGMLNRLETAGLLSRQRDPADGRRVIVRRASESEPAAASRPLPATLAGAWTELLAAYNDEQIGCLLDFFKRANMLSREALERARDVPVAEGQVLSAPLDDVTTGRLVISSAMVQIKVLAADLGGDLYRATFDGSPPANVSTKNGVVSFRYPHRLWGLGAARNTQIVLNTAIPWQISIKGGASAIEAHLDGLDLTGLEIGGGVSSIEVELPVPTRAVPIRISGGASEITVRRPEGVPARAHLKGWASNFVFDGHAHSPMRKTTLVHSPDYDANAPHYDIEVASPASMVTITTI